MLKMKPLTPAERDNVRQAVQIYLVTNGIPQNRLAKYCGLNSSTVSNFVHGKTGFSPVTVVKVADAMRVNYADLVSGAAIQAMTLSGTHQPELIKWVN